MLHRVESCLNRAQINRAQMCHLALQVLANMLSSLGRHSEALPLMRRALALNERAVGPKGQARAPPRRFLSGRGAFPSGCGTLLSGHGAFLSSRVPYCMGSIHLWRSIQIASICPGLSGSVQICLDLPDLP